MSLIALLTTCFLASFGLGFSKFFGLEHLCLKIYSQNDREWIIQVVGAVMTIGPALIYFLSGPLAQSFKKRHIMMWSCLATALLFITGHYSSWAGSIWFYLFSIGLFLGLYSAAKLSCVPFQAQQSKQSAISINAWLSIVFVVGILLGLVFGSKFYLENPLIGVWVGVGIFTMAGLSALGVRYEDEKVSSLKDNLARMPTDTVSLLLRYPTYLFSGPLFWGVAGAAGLAITAYGVKMNIGSVTACSLMPLYAAVGTVIGNIISPRFKRKKYLVAFVSSLMMLSLLIALPIVTKSSIALVEQASDIYPLLAWMTALMGLFFGLATNIVDAEYLDEVSKEGRGGTGAALQSALVSFFSFSVGGAIAIFIIQGWADSSTQFILLALLNVFGVFMLLILAVKKGDLNHFILFSANTFSRLILSLRYKIDCKGIESVPAGKSLVFLPNHPALMDPLILMSRLWHKYKIRPVVDEGMYNNPMVHGLLKRMHAFSMPDMSHGAGWGKKDRITKAMKDVVEALGKGDNILIYPAGKLMNSGLEKIGAASGAHSLLSQVPSATPVMVRTRGLWGSSFSRDGDERGYTPELQKSWVRAIKALLCAGIFFLPRRKVELQLSSAPFDFPRKAELLEFNQWLENHYNEPGEEKATRVSLGVMESSVIRRSKKKLEDTIDLKSIPEEITQAVYKELSRLSGLAEDKLKPNMHLGEDLGLDSISKAEVLVFLEETYEKENVEMDCIDNVSGVLLEASSVKKETVEKKPLVTGGWKKPESPLHQPAENSLQQAFLKVISENPDAEMMAEELSGVVLTRNRVLLSSILISKKLKLTPEGPIGVMLPAATGASIASMSVLLAGRSAVMFNWTMGRRNLESSVKSSGVRCILTSRSFLDRLRGVELEGISHLFYYLEDIKKNTDLGDLFQCWSLSRKSPERISHELGLQNVKSSDTAVVLFTSGSESAPKGVPLSHTNLLSNIRGSLQAATMQDKDVVAAFLPPFHSFGLTISTLMPLTTGLRVVYHSNPTEGKVIARMCRNYQASFIFGTPSFLTNIYRNFASESPKNLRAVVSGAEKAPEALKKLCAKLTPEVSFLEGYGATECSPVITIHRPGEKPEGVGRPLEGVHLCIVDPDTHHTLEKGKTGIVLVRGDSVFSGYLSGENNPFIHTEGHNWYNTGDLGFLNDSGALILAGRLKRFVKSAGEMISLPALETALSENWPAGDEGPVLAVEALEHEGQKPIICLFTSLEIELEDVNTYLKKIGFSNLTRITKLNHLSAIPQLGSGKTNYRELKELLKS